MITRLRRVVPEPLAPGRTAKTSSWSSYHGRIPGGLLNPPTPGLFSPCVKVGVLQATGRAEDADDVVDAQPVFGESPNM